jgi:5'-3' exonuclease
MNNIFEQSDMHPTFIFVDGSYYCFYRFHALKNWWKNAHPDEPLTEPIENTTFVEKFKKTFVENLLAIPKKLKLHKSVSKPITVVAKDCKRKNIWRMNLFAEYKGSRKTDNQIGPFFEKVYSDDLFEKGGAQAILKHPNLEADDCIAISIKYLLHKYPECQIYIITGDHDYLQLCNDRVTLYNLTFKNIAEKSSCGDAHKDLQLKIIMGDTSDNIPAVFPKCGLKTAQKCIEDPEFFKKKMDDNPDYYAQYELNKQLVDFENIPEQLVAEFMATIKK